MFHFEDTTRVEDLEKQEDRLIILDGTARLDYLENPPDDPTEQSLGVMDKLRQLWR